MHLKDYTGVSVSAVLVGISEKYTHCHVTVPTTVGLMLTLSLAVEPHDMLTLSLAVEPHDMLTLSLAVEPHETSTPHSEYRPQSLPTSNPNLYPSP